MGQLIDVTPDVLQAVQRGLKTLYLKQYSQATQNAWEALLSRENSDGEGETYPAIGAPAGMRPWTGTRQYSTMRTDAFQVKNGQYEYSFKIPKADIERDKLGRYNGLIGRAARKAARYMIPLIQDLLANGTSLAKTRCWDDKPLFSAQHGKGKNNQTNIITGSGVDTIAHVQDDIEQCISAGAGFMDDQGDFIDQIVYNTAIYPSGNFALGKLLRTISQGRQGLDQPDESASIQAVIPCPKLTGNTWYMAAGGGAERPFAFQEEVAPRPDTSYDFDTMEMKFGLDARGAAFCADWMTILQVSNPGGS